MYLRLDSHRQKLSQKQPDNIPCLPVPARACPLHFHRLPLRPDRPQPVHPRPDHLYPYHHPGPDPCCHPDLPGFDPCYRLDLPGPDPCYRPDLPGPDPCYRPDLPGLYSCYHPAPQGPDPYQYQYHRLILHLHRVPAYHPFPHYHQYRSPVYHPQPV